MDGHGTPKAITPSNRAMIAGTLSLSLGLSDLI